MIIPTNLLVGMITENLEWSLKLWRFKVIYFGSDLFNSPGKSGKEGQPVFKIVEPKNLLITERGLEYDLSTVCVI